MDRKHNIKFLASTISLLFCGNVALAADSATTDAHSTSTAGKASKMESSAVFTGASKDASTAPAHSPEKASDQGASADRAGADGTSSDAIALDAIAKDPMLRAFRDELARTESKLTLGGHPPPYFTSYLSHEQEHYNIFGSFGALDRCDEEHHKWLNIDVRAGDRRLDSESGPPSPFDREGSNASLDDNYDAIRHELWLRTDRAYKHAIEGLESKKATLQQKKVLDLPDAMSPAPPVVSIQPRNHLVIDKDKWQKEIRDISAMFKYYPAVLNSEVSLISRSQTRWYTNSEGSANREGDGGAVIGMTASGQAKDGMDVADFEMFGGGTPAQLPAEEFLKVTARGLGERVTALANAPIIEDYRGPVLFEKQAAAEFFAQTLTPSLVNPNERLSHFSSFMFSGGLKEKLGRRILPSSMSVIDDPLATEFKGAPLKGGYLVDDEGVKAQKVVLVQNGILKTLCSGRTPSRYVKQTNGHWHGGGAGPSILIISSTDCKPVPDLKAQLIKMGKEDGLTHVLIVRKITSLYLRYFNAGEPGFKSLRAGLRSGDMSLATPTLLYKVNVNDGSEELVRGARFEHLSSRMWRDIVGIGDDASPYLVLTAGLSSNATSSSLVTPSILISEIDVTKSQQEGEKPMLLKNPYFEKASIRTQPPG